MGTVEEDCRASTSPTHMAEASSFDSGVKTAEARRHSAAFAATKEDGRWTMADGNIEDQSAPALIQAGHPFHLSVSAALCLRGEPLLAEDLDLVLPIRNFGRCTQTNHRRSA